VLLAELGFFPVVVGFNGLELQAFCKERLAF
jgi:hypothetical protein